MPNDDHNASVEKELRMACLKLAHSENLAENEVVVRACAYYDFVVGRMQNSSSGEWSPSKVSVQHRV